MEVERREDKENNKYRAYVKYIVAGVLIIAVFWAVAWFFNQRELDTLTWIKTPLLLEIGSGNNHDIQYMDMGELDADKEKTYTVTENGKDVTYHYKDFVFCVYGKPVNIYSLQLAYTTNIAFYYDVYRADYAPDTGNVDFTYIKDGIETTEKFNFSKDGEGNRERVIEGKPYMALTSGEIKEHQRHELTFGDEKGENAPVEAEKVQSNAQPLYWLAKENGTNAMNPKTQIEGNTAFLDYYILRVRWKQGTVINNKETDIVYLAVSS